MRHLLCHHQRLGVRLRGDLRRVRDQVWRDFEMLLQRELGRLVVAEEGKRRHGFREQRMRTLPRWMRATSRGKGGGRREKGRGEEGGAAVGGCQGATVGASLATSRAGAVGRIKTPCKGCKDDRRDGWPYRRILAPGSRDVQDVARAGNSWFVGQRAASCPCDRSTRTKKGK